MLLAAALGAWLGSGLYVKFKKQNLERNACDSQQMQASLKRINANLPRRIDEITTLKSIGCEGGRFSYSAELDAERLPADAVNALAAELKTTNRKLYCDEKLSGMRTLVLGANYDYYAKDGKFILRVGVDNDECR